MLGDNLGELNGEWGERKAQREEIHTDTHTHTQSYDRFVLLYMRNQHNFVKQLSSR